MKGQILTVTEHDGIILGEDDKRYPFNIKEWKENFPPCKGEKVDFEIDGEYAKNIYSLRPEPFINKNEILNSAGLLGGLGSISILLSIIPLIGSIFGIVGYILLLIAFKKITDIDPQKKVFKNFLFATLLPVLIAIVIGIILAILLPKIMPYSDSDTVMLVLWIFLGTPVFIMMAIYWRKTFMGVYEITQISHFKTCAEMFFWGELLSIIIIGIFIVFVAWIISAIAFFSLRKGA